MKSFRNRSDFDCVSRFLLDAGEHSEAQGKLCFLPSRSDAETLSYADLLESARRALFQFTEQGMRSGDRAIIQAADSKSQLIMLWGCLLGGIVPALLPRVSARGVETKEGERLRGAIAALEQPHFVAASNDITALQDTDAGALLGDARLVGVDTSFAESGPVQIRLPNPNDCAYIQFSSGSTRAPKGVQLSHANLINNVSSMIKRAGFTQQNATCVSWMPYTHDMGLIGFHLLPLALGATQVKIEALDFLRDPMHWLSALDRFKAGNTGSPNFGLEHVLDRVSEQEALSLDLSHLRTFQTGAEPIRARTLTRFARLMAHAKLAETSIYPVYGLAEVCLGATTPDFQAPPRLVRFDRNTLRKDARAVAVSGEVDSEDKTATTLVAVGTPIPDMELSIRGEDNAECLDGTVGEICLRGPSVMIGYINADQAVDAEGWLHTNDLGFVMDGQLFVTGRRKNVLIVNGRKLMSSDVEEYLGETLGLSAGTVAVTSHADDAQMDRITVFVQKRRLSALGDGDMATGGQIVARAAASYIEGTIHRVVPVSTIPRTTSGKIQNFVLSEKMAAGEFADAAIDPSGTTFSFDLTPSDPRDVRLIVRRLWSELLEVDESQFDDHVPFAALGGSSVKAFLFISRLEADLGRPLSTDILIDCKTVAEIVDALSDGRSERPLPKATPQRANGDRSVAIVGMAGRFPDAPNLDRYWQNLRTGHVSIRPAPFALSDGNPCYWAPLDDKAAFPAAAFGISDHEARIMDPAQRIMLELAQEALEDSGLSGARLPRNQSVGVYIGAGYSGNAAFLEQADLPEDLRNLPEMLVGNLPNIISARIAKHFGFQGPALTLDTACSSSLVALHYACRDLASGVCDLALVGGINLINGPAQHEQLAQAGALSRSGRSMTFSADADGIVPGEGAGIVVLRREEDAVASRDRIDAIVVNTTINNDGRSLSLMAPNAEGQERLLVRNLAEAGCDADGIGLIEAHTTGTPIGDPVELHSMARGFAASQAESGCRIGTVKANIGHLLAAAGIASLIKTVLSLRHSYCPPLPVPQDGLIDFAGTGFIPSEGTPWAATGGKPLALVNSFGFGGTNAQAILAPALPAEIEDDKGHSDSVPLVLDAVDADGLKQTAQMVQRWLLDRPETALPALARTLWLRNRDGSARAATRVTSVSEVLDWLGSPDANGLTDGDPLASWSAGQTVDIAGVFDAVGHAAPLPLPPTPRQRMHFELPGQFPRAAATVAPFTADLKFGGALGRNIENWLYQTAWEPAPIQATQMSVEHAVVVLVGFASQDLDSIADALRAIEVEPAIVRVAVGDGTLDKAAKDALSARQWSRVFDLRPLAEKPDSLDAHEAASDAGMTALAEFQCLAAHMKSLPETPRVIAVTARDRGCIAADMLWAFARSLDLEWGSGTYASLQLDHLALAIDAVTSIAKADLRGSLRWTPNGPMRERLAPVELAPAKTLSLVGKVAIIVGGTGGIGRILAADLAQRGVKKLYLTGRRSQDDLPDDVLSAFAALRSAGTDVVYHSLNLRDDAAIAAFAQMVSVDVGSPALLVHAATDDIVIDAAAINRTEVEDQCTAKVAGSLSLIHHFGPVVDGRIVLFGSLTGLTGAKGQSLYAAANRGQSAVTDLARRTGTDVRLVNWGVWQDTGRVRDLPPDVLSGVVDSGSQPMEPQDALELFAHLIERETPAAVHVANISHAKARSLGVETSVAQSEAACSAYARGAQMDSIGTAHAALHDYCALRLFEEFQESAEGFSAPTPRADLRTQLQVHPDRLLHFDRMIDILCEDGLLTKTPAQKLVRGRLSQPDHMAALRSEICDQHAEGRNIVDYIDHCISGLPDVLSGRIDATTVLCPDGNTDDLARLYRLDEGLQTAQEMVALVLAEQATPDFDILEIGGGTGALTETVLASLTGARGHYLFTDIGQGFLNRAKQHYANQDRFAVTRFDLESPPSQQGLADLRVDAVIGSNVLHAVGDLVPAINRLRSMLKPGGWLILVETFGPHRAADCTVGMFDGWWAFRDYDVRPSYPLMGVRNWQAILGRAGFDVACVPAKLSVGKGEVETGVVLARLRHTQEHQQDSFAGKNQTALLTLLGGQAKAGDDTQPDTDAPNPVDGANGDPVLSVLQNAPALRGIENVDPDTDFFDIGLDSITALELVGHIETQLKVSLSPTAFFEFSTLRSLSEHVTSLTPQLPAAPLADTRRDTVVTQPAPISKLSSEEPPKDFPLSDAAMRMWIANGLQDNPATYTIENALRLEGRLELETLERALKTVIEEQDGLRCRLIDVQGTPRLGISESAVLNLRHVDLSDAPDVEAAIDAIRIEEKHSAFDLETEPPLRVVLVRLSKLEHVLVTTMHHLFSDGWSLNVLVRRVAEIYNAELQGQPRPAPRGELRLGDWLQDSDGQRGGAASALDAAMAQIGSDAEPVSLPWDRAPTGMLSGAGHLAMMDLGHETTQHLRKQTAAAGVTLFQMASGLFATWLGRISGQDNVTFLTPSAGRDDARLQDVIGFFVNMLPIRMDVALDQDLSATAKTARDICDAAFARRAVGYDQIVAKLDTQRAPLAPQPFNTALIVQGRQWSTGMRLAYAGLTVEAMPEIAPAALYDLTVFFRETDDDIRIELNGSCDVFDRASVETLLGYFVDMLRNAVNAPEAPVYAAPMADTATLQHVAQQSVSDAMAMVQSNRIEAEFEAIAARHADRVCLADDTRAMTYAEVDAAANRLARTIRDSVGASSKGLVALYLRRGLDGVVAMLAVAKAGLAYLPLSDRDGPDRLRHILSVAKPVLAIVDQPDPSCWVGVDLPQIDLTADADAISRHDPTALPPSDVASIEPLYVLFTSGSTGEPKGVEIRHDNVLSLVRNSEDLFGFTPEDVWSCLHAFTFDFSTWEVWGPLLTGGKMVLIDDDTRRDPSAMAAYIVRHGVTVMNATPNVFYQFDQTMADNPQLEARHHIRQVIFGGDRLAPARLARWIGRNPLDQTALSNCFGITETTVHVSHHALSHDDIGQDVSVIGGALPGYAMVLRDKLGHPTAPGLPGEIWVGGAGVANGYVGQPGLTSDRFRSLPDTASGSPVLFRSGDLGRQRFDGRVEYLGRSDRQLKFLGYRIEPGEIETALQKHPDIHETFVLVGPDVSGHSQLAAFVVGGPNMPHSLPELREFLGPVLPTYMLPSRLIHAEALPLNRNGKVDRGVLLDMLRKETAAAPAEIEQATTETEAAVMAIFADVLGRREVGRHTEFFDVGGNSILAGQLHNRLCREFQLNLDLRDVFMKATPAVLAGVIDEQLSASPADALEWETGEI